MNGSSGRTLMWTSAARMMVQQHLRVMTQCTQEGQGGCILAPVLVARAAEGMTSSPAPPLTTGASEPAKGRSCNNRTMLKTCRIWTKRMRRWGRGCRSSQSTCRYLDLLIHFAGRLALSLVVHLVLSSVLVHSVHMCTTVLPILESFDSKCAQTLQSSTIRSR